MRDTLVEICPVVVEAKITRMGPNLLDMGQDGSKFDECRLHLASANRDRANADHFGNIRPESFGPCFATPGPKSIPANIVPCSAG